MLGANRSRNIYINSVEKELQTERNIIVLHRKIVFRVVYLQSNAQAFFMRCKTINWLDEYYR